eukprot:GHVN01106059.1.p1 GENE.GHVN01106059.1~~GHVN01106059.1.p1  ORF type:complete len:331 (+),score=28.95 GHVN01106059.1:548-1540(+)
MMLAESMMEAGVRGGKVPASGKLSLGERNVSSDRAPPALHPLSSQHSFVVGDFTRLPHKLRHSPSSEDDWWFTPDSLQSGTDSSTIKYIVEGAGETPPTVDGESDHEVELGLDDPTGLWLKNLPNPMGTKVLLKMDQYEYQITELLDVVQPLAERFTRYSNKLAKEKIKRRMQRCESLSTNLQAEYKSRYERVLDEVLPLFDVDREVEKLMRSRLWRVHGDPIEKRLDTLYSRIRSNWNIFHPFILYRTWNSAFRGLIECIAEGELPSNTFLHDVPQSRIPKAIGDGGGTKMAKPREVAEPHTHSVPSNLPQIVPLLPDSPCNNRCGCGD